MKLFRRENRDCSDEARRIYATYELLHTGVDFLAALLFLIGSIMFFWASLETIAIWCFVIGSVFFATKPTIKLVREVRLARQGELVDPATQSKN